MIDRSIASMRHRSAQQRLAATVAGLAAVLLVGVVAVAPPSEAIDEAAVAATQADTGMAAPVDDLGIHAQSSTDDDAEAQQPPADREQQALSMSVTRDPFEPVVPDATPEPGEPGDDPVNGDDPLQPADPDDPFNGTTAPSDDDLPPGATSGCVGDDEVVCDGQVVTLVGIEDVDGAQVALIRVGSTTYAVSEGERFRDELLLERIEDRCVVIRHVDGDTVRVCQSTADLK